MSVGDGNRHIGDSCCFGKQFWTERHDGGDTGWIVGIQPFSILQSADVKAFPNFCYQLLSQLSVVVHAVAPLLFGLSRSMLSLR